VKRLRSAEVVVLGAGPVGLVAALESSKHRRTSLIARHLPSGDEVPTVEALPASILALLVEFGIHPRQIGVEHLHESRLIAWERETFAESNGPVEAHIERPALDLALFRAVVDSGRVRITLGDHASIRAVILAARNGEVRLIDATGRTAISAQKKVRLTKPWAARTFPTSRYSSLADTTLRIAALPGGFVYRLGASRHLLLGIVGRKETIVGSHSVLERRIRDYGAGWVLDEFPPMAALTPGRISSASVQWTTEGAATTIGDAALARDVLSSQGLATGISEALYAAAIVTAEDEAFLSLRKVEQRVAHLRSMEKLIARCRFRQNEAWREYAEFVAEHLDHDPPLLRVSLRANRVSLAGRAS
jgi:flavin-dependent dehydrogenase